MPHREVLAFREEYEEEGGVGSWSCHRICLTSLMRDYFSITLRSVRIGVWLRAVLLSHWQCFHQLHLARMHSARIR